MLLNGWMIPMKDRNHPYYCFATEDFVMDEMCCCGHLKSEHGSVLVKMRKSKVSLRIPADGGCCEGMCGCKKFRWERFVYTDEYAQIITSRQKRRNTASG